MVGVAIYDILKNDTDVAALVGTKIYPIQASETATVPYITYQEISNVPASSKDSVSLLDQLRIQVSSFADTQDNVFSLAKKVRIALDKVTGIYSNDTFITVVRQLDFDGEIHLYLDNAAIFEIAQDYMIWCTENEGGIGVMIIGTDFTIT